MKVPPNLADESPTAKLVYLTLERMDGPVSQHELADELDIHVRQVRGALAVLDQHDLLEERPNLSDLREKHYDVVTPDV